ncbi:MAG: polysaccharide biosynthesis tyrosine autokinase [Planctomycetes bacterium]|nr:polysaccharide biosynthesis tyrosine autokinase [Planctomycetota bacterium]
MNGRIEGNLSDPAEATPFVETVEGFSESLFEILWRRRWTVLVAVIVAMAAGLIYLQRATPLYTSTSRLYVEQAGPEVWEKDASGVVTRWSNYLYTQAELLKQSGTLSVALALPGMGNLQTFAGVDNPVTRLRRKLDVVVGKKDEIIDVSFTCPYPEEAAHLVNSVVDAYITQHNERRRNTSAEIVKILREEKTQRDAELKDKLQRMVDFSQANEGLAYGASQESNVIMRRLDRFQQALDDAQLATIECKAFHETVRKMADDPVGLRQFIDTQRARGVYIAATNEATTLRAELRRLERERADCLQRLKSDAPPIAALDAEIERVRMQIAEMDEEFTSRQLAVAEELYLAAVGREKELTDGLEQQRQAAIALNRQLSQYTLLRSDYEQTLRFCEILDDKIRKLNVDPDVGALTVQIVETAVPAIEPSEPQKARTMGLALCLGLFAGVGLALLRQWKDQRLHSTQEIGALLGLPVLGAIPSMTAPKQTPAIRGQKIRISPESREAEAFRTVRTALFFGAPKDEARTILVTSPAPGEGKTTTVSNLGIAMAQAGQRTLIVDTDFRRPMQHKVFGLNRQARGLSCVLVGQMGLDEAIEELPMANLFVLTCGPDVPNPAEMLNSDRFAEIVKTLAGRYDRVLIDSPPVIAVADAQIVAALCDVTVLVLRAHKSMRRVSMQACDSLAGVGGRILGVVVNDVPRKSDRYGYSGGYGYSDYSYRRSGGNGHARTPTPIVEIGVRDQRPSGDQLQRLRAGLMPDVTETDAPSD